LNEPNIIENSCLNDYDGIFDVLTNKDDRLNLITNDREEEIEDDKYRHKSHNESVNVPIIRNLDFVFDPPPYCTVVSAYWRVDNSKYSHKEYERWFSNSLRINVPYIFFTSYDLFPMIENFRKGLKTLLVEKNITSFRAFHTYSQLWKDDYHMPSPTLGLIWLEKLNLMRQVVKMVNSKYIVWVDAGISHYRDTLPLPYPWSNIILDSLPRDRASYAIVHEPFHSFAATYLIVPRDLVSLISHMFYTEYDGCRRGEIEELPEPNWYCGSEQYLLTRMRNRHPQVFHITSYEYGDIDFLWNRNTNNIDSI
jgi:hypothetical protein